MRTKVLNELNIISDQLEDLIEKQLNTWYSERELSGEILRDLEIVSNELSKTINQIREVSQWQDLNRSEMILINISGKN